MVATVLRYSAWARSFATTPTLSNLGDAYAALEALRKRDTNAAIEMLEFRLDSEIIALSALALEEPDGKMRDAYMRALARVRNYRSTYPRKSDSPEIDQAVANALASVEEYSRK